VISAARRIAFSLLRRIELEGVFSDAALSSPQVSNLDARDRNLTTEIVYGTLRKQALLDHVLSTQSSRPWDEVCVDIRVLLRMSLYQMWHMDRIPDHALVHDAVELAKQAFVKKGASAFVNGLLRSLGRQRPWLRRGFEEGLDPWIRASLPYWLWERWMARFGPTEALEYALSLNHPPRCAIRFESSREGRRSLPEGVVPSDLVPGAYFVGEVPKGGGFRIQDEASQLIPQIVGDLSGWRIWDACAAPGGKSAILSERCGSSGFLVLSDLSWERTRLLAVRFAEDAALSDSYILVADAARTPPFRALFDLVVADVPCSGLGTLRRNPEIKWRYRPDLLPGQQHTQIAILNAVADAVRIGGRLLYCTCSTEPEENEMVLDTFLGSHRDFQIAKPDLPHALNQWIDARGFLRTFPSTRPWDGFFAAIMVRFS